MSGKDCGARWLAALLIVSLAACAGSDKPPADATALVVTTDKGALRGAVVDGVESFLDIPYAAPPVGPLRWAPPQPAAAWSGIRPAGSYGRYCTQRQNFDSPDGPALDEDCLSINVQRPIGTSANARLPVYVYIHGGGFATGSGVKDTQEKIVQENGVVGVSLNYRLGALGFLALPSLDGGDRQTGDYGLLDQQAALRWVHANIAAFGGDPDRVTIGGESAGGWSVCAHLAAPGSKGLFAQALMQSGSCVSHGLAQAEAEGAKFAARVGCGDRATQAQCLRGKPVAALLAAQAMLYVPTHGTPLLPQAPREAIAAGAFARVPVLIGSTRDEGRSFSRKSIGWSRAQYDRFVRASFGRNAPAVLRAYPYPRDDADPSAVAYQVGAIGTDDGALGADIVERGIGGCGNVATTQALARSVPVYAYEFSHRDGPGWVPTPGYLWGAGHAAELTYLYPRHEGGKTYAAFTPAERALSDAMLRDWGAFVRQGHPGQAGHGDWPPYLPGERLLSLDVGAASTVITDAVFRQEHRCAFWDHLAGTPVTPAR